MQTKEQIQDSQEAGAELLQVEQSSNANVVTEMAGYAGGEQHQYFRR